MTVVSSVFPVLPIVILFFVKRLLVRLALILVFIAIFAGVLVFGMRLEPDKTLAITTALVSHKLICARWDGTDDQIGSLPFKWSSLRAQAMELEIDPQTCDNQ